MRVYTCLKKDCRIRFVCFLIVSNFLFPPHILNATEMFTDLDANLTGAANSCLSWGDYNNDGYPDLAVAGNLRSKIYQNNQDGSFTDINAGLVGVGKFPRFCSISWGDYDNDGDLDIALAGDSDDGRVSKIYRNDDGSFIDVNAGIIPVKECALDWGDYNNDGLLDLAITGDSENGPVSRIYRNDGGDVFTDINADLTDVSGGDLEWGDYDNDGYLDLGIVGCCYNCHIYKNDSSGGFVDSTNITGGLLGGYDEFTWGDYDNDGDLDFAIAAPGYNRIWRNDNGVFTDINAGLPGWFDMKMAWGDYNNDGKLDLVVVGQDQSSNRLSRIFQNNGNESFVEIDADLAGMAAGSVKWADYDNDDDLDIAICGIDIEVMCKVFRNNLGDIGDLDLTMQADPIEAGVTTPPMGTRSAYLTIPIGIYAHPAKGYAFRKWAASPSENAIFEDPCAIFTTVTLTDNATVTANFITSGLPADIDNNGSANFCDFALLALPWLQNDCNSSNNWCDDTDLDQSDSTDLNDLAIFAASWLDETGLKNRLAHYYSYEERDGFNGLVDLAAGKKSLFMWGEPIVESNGISSYGWLFDGNDAIAWDDTLLPDLEEGDNFTLSMWGYNTGLTNNNDSIWSTYYTGGVDSYFLIDIYQGSLRFIGVNMGFENSYTADIVSIFSNQWYHYVWRKDGTNYTIFVNGAVVFSADGSDAIIWNKNVKRRFMIGSQNSVSPGNYWWNGYFDEFGVWLRSLSDQEILTLYNDGEGLSYSDIIGTE